VTLIWSFLTLLNFFEFTVYRYYAVSNTVILNQEIVGKTLAIDVTMT
jgi:hypothetical protein